MNDHISLSRRAARTLALLAVLGANLMLSMPVWAELSPALDRISISVGSYRGDPKFNASLNTPYGDLQSGDIRLGKDTMPRVKADMMIFDSQGLSFDYFQYKQAYAGSIASNTNINGTSLTTVGSANLDIKLDFAKLAYKWWLGNGNTVVGLGAGAAYYRIGLNANATASVNSATAAISNGYRENAVAPLLEIGVRHAFSPDLRLFANVSGAKKSGGQLHGEVYNASVGVEWFLVKHVGVVVDYSMNQLDLQRDATITEKFKVRSQGPSAFVKVRF